MTARTAPAIRQLVRGDAAAITAIDAAHTGKAKRRFWEEVVARHAGAHASRRVGLVATDGRGGRVVGYLLAQVRAFEFGSEECGWIYAVGVRPDYLRTGVARGLLDAAVARLAALGITIVRTMVRRDDVPVLTFFRSSGFAAGPYVEMELHLEEESP